MGRRGAGEEGAGAGAAVGLEGAGAGDAVGLEGAKVMEMGLEL